MTIHEAIMTYINMQSGEYYIGKHIVTNQRKSNIGFYLPHRYRSLDGTTNEYFLNFINFVSNNYNGDSSLSLKIDDIISTEWEIKHYTELPDKNQFMHFKKQAKEWAEKFGSLKNETSL